MSIQLGIRHHFRRHTGTLVPTSMFRPLTDRRTYRSLKYVAASVVDQGWTVRGMHCLLTPGRHRTDERFFRYDRLRGDTVHLVPNLLLSSTCYTYSNQTTFTNSSLNLSALLPRNSMDAFRHYYIYYEWQNGTCFTPDLETYWEPGRQELELTRPNGNTGYHKKYQWFDS